MRDFYRVLELPRDASQLAIKRAYRKLAKQCHPDLHPNDPTAAERFRRLSDAYDVLGNPDKRFAYDRELMGFQHRPEPQYTRWTAREVGFEAFEQTWFGGGPLDVTSRELRGAVIGTLASVAYVLAAPPVQAEALLYAFVGSVVGSSFGSSLARTLRELVHAAAGCLVGVTVAVLLGAGTSGFLWYWGTIFAWTDAPPDEPGALLAFRGVVGAIGGSALGALVGALTADRADD